MDCFTHHCSAAAALLTGDLWADLRGVHRIHHNGYSAEQQQPPEGEKNVFKYEMRFDVGRPKTIGKSRK